MGSNLWSRADADFANGFFNKSIYCFKSFFVFLTIGFLVELLLLHYPNIGFTAAFCFGLAYPIGIVNVYYLTGLMIKKFRSRSFYRACYLMATCCYFLANVAVTFISRETMQADLAIIDFSSICLLIVFFFLTPLFIRMLYSGEWIDDFYREDISHQSRLEAKLKDFKLTPAETEVCVLLLEGYTLRQIAAMQGKAYSTINTYCTSIYRKMNINSRIELLLLLQEYK